MKKIIALLTSLVMTFSLVACSQSASTTTTTAATTAAQTQAETTTSAPKNLVFKIGGLGPLTGGAAVYGNAVKNGETIAVDRINQAGGINGYQVELYFEDDEHDVEKAINGYNVLKDQGIQVLVGTTTSSPCVAVGEETFKDNMFQITPSGSSVECTTNPNVFRVCFSDPNQGIASAQYIASHDIAKKVGIIYDSSDVYSTGIYEKFVEESSNLNKYEIVAEESFTADSKTDFTTQLTKIRDAGADLLFLPFYYSEAALVLNQANSMGYKPTFFSCDGMDGILTLDNFDNSLAEGVMLLTPFSADATDELTSGFVSEYRSKYGETPNQFAADAFDGVYIVKAAMEYANVTPDMSISEICEKIKGAMTKITVNGLTGNNIVWTADGEPNKEPKAVVIENGVYKLMEG